MSKSAVEVAEVAKIPIVEVVEELVQPQKEEEPSEEVKNRLRVQFTKPIVKYIGIRFICHQLYLKFCNR